MIAATPDFDPVGLLLNGGGGAAVVAIFLVFRLLVTHKEMNEKLEAKDAACAEKVVVLERVADIHMRAAEVATRRAESAEKALEGATEQSKLLLAVLSALKSVKESDL